MICAFSREQLDRFTRADFDPVDDLVNDDQREAIVDFLFPFILADITEAGFAETFAGAHDDVVIRDEIVSEWLGQLEGSKKIADLALKEFDMGVDVYAVRLPGSWEVCQQVLAHRYGFRDRHLVPDMPVWSRLSDSAFMGPVGSEEAVRKLT